MNYICNVCQGIIDKIQSNLDLYSNYWCENKKCIIDKIYYENKVQADYITLKGKHYLNNFNHLGSNKSKQDVIIFTEIIDHSTVFNRIFCPKQEITKTIEQIIKQREYLELLG